MLNKPGTAILALIFSGLVLAEEPTGAIRLLVRGDDIGSSHSANVGCIESYQNGILRSVELMPTTPWFPEAVRLLNEHPGLDVGIHLTLTSEWSNVKWRPLTAAPSLVDGNGFFFPMVWPNKNFPAGCSIRESAWKLEEIEKELRAQIELSLKNVPPASHLSTHMGFTSLDPSLEALVEKLAGEFKLGYRFKNSNLQPFSGWEGALSLSKRIDAFAANLKKLQPGTWLFVDHPGKDTPEMQAVHHPGYEDVASDREWVTRVFTSEKIKKIIQNRKIQLISYRDIINEMN